MRKSSWLGRYDWLRDSGNLSASSDYAGTRRIVYKRYIFVFALSLLPNFNLASSPYDTNSHGGEKVMGSVGVKVNTTVKHSCGVFPNTRVNHSSAAGVVLDEVPDIVDDTGNRDQSPSVASLLLEIFEFNNRELLERDTPVELSTNTVELLLHLLKSALFNLV